MNRTCSIIKSVYRPGGAVIAALSIMAACTESAEIPSDGGDPPPAEVAPRVLSQAACLRKAALDLIEKAPSAQDLDDLASARKTLGDIVDTYLASTEFATVVFQWFLDKFEPTSLVPATADKEEPARIAQYLITNDLDFRALVTADYTIGPDRQRRAASSAAGVLATQTYLSAYTGLENRNWGGRLLSGLAGIVLVPISNIPEGTDSSKGGVAANPACAGCHVSPLYGVDNAASFHDCYDDRGLPIPQCQRQADTQLLGQTGRTLADLGRILAESVEWRATMIQTFYVHLGGRLIAKNETAQYRDYEAAWLAANYRPKALIKQIVTSSQYCSR